MMRVEQQKQFTLEFLKAYHPADELERAYVQEVVAFIQSQDNPFYPQLPAGHITVSSILMDQKQQNILKYYLDLYNLLQHLHLIHQLIL